MPVAVCGSVATDHLMTFPGRFSDSLVAERLDRVSLSFLVDELQVRRGGVGANIAFGMASLGLRPVLVAAVGLDFAEYRAWLEGAGVDCSGVRVSSTQHTARFLCTTDTEQCQIASFYPGAMSEAREIDVTAVASGADLVVVAPDDPEAMLRHTRACRESGVPFAADPSQQLARMEGPEIRQLVSGARYLLLNDYELHVLQDKTGWTSEQVLEEVDTRVTTLGAQGARIERADGFTVTVPAVPDAEVVDPTGVGDAFRAGFLAADGWGHGPERAAQVGALVAAAALATVGTQEYVLDPEGLLAQMADVYGAEAADDVRPHLAPA